MAAFWGVVLECLNIGTGQPEKHRRRDEDVRRVELPSQMMTVRRLTIGERNFSPLVHVSLVCDKS